MGTVANQLLIEVLKLPMQDRGDIALQLLETLDDDDEDVTEAELLAELQTRVDEGFEGATRWSELREMR